MATAVPIVTVNLPQPDFLARLLLPHQMIVQPTAVVEILRSVKITLAHTPESPFTHIVVEGLSEDAALFTKGDFPRDWVTVHSMPTKIMLPEGVFLATFVVNLQKILTALTQGVLEGEPLVVRFADILMELETPKKGTARYARAHTQLFLELGTFPNNFHKIYKTSARLWHQRDSLEHVLFHTEQLAQGFKRTVGFASKDSERPQFNGVRICATKADVAASGSESALIFSATDGHAVAWVPVGAPADASAHRKPVDAILGTKATSTLVQIADAVLASYSGKDERTDAVPKLCWRQFLPDTSHDPLVECYVVAPDKPVAGGKAFDAAPAILYVRPVPASWPDLSQAFLARAAREVRVRVHAGDLKRAVVAAKTHSSTGMLDFSLSEDTLKISARSNSGTQENTLMVECATTMACKWSMSSNYLGLVIAAQTRTDPILHMVLHVTAEGHVTLPIHFYYDTRPDAKWLVMPTE